ncbi:MAG: roadblock/LC7 domain-containing protein [Verrucomicrobiota bacterium]
MITALSEQDQRAIQSEMAEFLKKAECQWAALVDKGGNLFAQCGETHDLDLGILSALGAGSFAATHELAKRLGEKEFASLYHEGKDMGILMTSLVLDCLLITVFNKQTQQGLVRHYIEQLAPTLNALLADADTRPPEPLQLDPPTAPLF